METINFSGAYLQLHTEDAYSYEVFYKSYTNSFPCFYKINNVDVSVCCLNFKLHFGDVIQDYSIINVHKNEQGKNEYVLCYVLEQDIFVIFDEIATTVKILYNRAKDEKLLQLIQLCIAYKCIA